jgi:uncharacterized protein Usg
MSNSLFLRLRIAGETETIAQFHLTERNMVSADFRRQLDGFGLTTANILYRMPDHPGILQSYIWQLYDLHPHFPELRKFLDFWTRELDGLLHSVTVAHADLIKPAEFKAGSFADRAPPASQVGFPERQKSGTEPHCCGSVLTRDQSFNSPFRPCHPCRRRLAQLGHSSSVSRRP